MDRVSTVAWALTDKRSYERNGLAISVIGLNKWRIKALADGIFATVMTVLVLSLSIPAITGTEEGVESYVLSLGPIVLSYVLSFLILGVFWVRHHNVFHFISRIDNRFIWLNIAFLLSIGFIPFSTELIGRYPLAEVSAVLYGANFVGTGISMQGIWLYAARRGLLITDGLSKEIMNMVNWRLTGGPILYLTAILVTLVTGSTTPAIVIYVVAIVYYVIASSLGGGRVRATPMTKSK